MNDREFYKYRQSVIAFLKIALNGELHTWALWEQIAKQLELLWDNIGDRSGADLDFISLYSDNLESIRHKMQETYEDCGFDKNDCGKRINSAIGGLVEKLTISKVTATQPETFEMDERLQTDKAKEIFKEFAAKGYIEIVENGHYKWLVTTNNSKALFAFFIGLFAVALDMRESNGNPSRKPFEDLFRIYGTARNANRTPYPKGRRAISDIMARFM